MKKRKEDGKEKSERKVKEIKEQIDSIYENNLEPAHLGEEQREIILTSIDLLDQGKIRVCEKVENHWVIHSWVKKSILLYFKIQKMDFIQAGDLNFFDKIPLKKWTGTEGVRVVPSALVRKGAYISSQAVLMPSYVNIGAFVGVGTMVDTWVTVGSCAQIGSHVHLSGGVGIGGVLEPLQGAPVVIEDHVFVGSRSVIVEGVRVEEGAVIGAGTVLTASTKIIDVRTNEVYSSYIPAYSVVIPGNRKKSYPAGEFFIPCALVIGKRKESTNQKTALTEVLRKYNVPV